jgi:prepilin-type N-terminal cleavage/methylation domain-containing protein
MLKLINKHLNKTRNEKGFTLVELIVVIAILGILIAIAVPRFASTTNAAEKSAAEANHRTLVSVSQLYYANEGSWPTGIPALVGEELIAESDFPESGDPSYSITAATETTDFTITVTFDGETRSWSPEEGFKDWTAE